MSIRIAVIGAGSREFGPATIHDLVLSGPLCEAGLEMVLMDLSDAEVQAAEAYARRAAELMGREVSVSSTTSLAQALEGADYVVTAIEAKRYFFWAQDFHVPRKYGFRQMYGENGGAGGLFHALRNMGPMVEVARTMEQVCPDAWLLNYTNPLTKLCEAITRLTTTKLIGLCHGVFYGKLQVCQLLEMEQEDLDAEASGLNHITWFHHLRHAKTGEDLYPRLRERARDANWLAHWDEIALSRVLLRTFGLFPSPGANHIGEYIGWADEYLASSKFQFFSDPLDPEPWTEGKTPEWIYNMHKVEPDRPLFGDTAIEIPALSARTMDFERDAIVPSGELAIPIMEGLSAGAEHYLAAVNVRNAGLVPGLPEDAIIEVPATVSSEGLVPKAMPALPDSVLAILHRQTTINKLLVRAFDEGSKSVLLEAMLLDPTVPSLRGARATIDELCGLQEEFLPEMDW